MDAYNGQFKFRTILEPADNHLFYNINITTDGCDSG